MKVIATILGVAAAVNAARLRGADRTLQFGFSETVVAGDDSSESTPVVTGELSFSGMTLEDAASNSGVIASGIATTFGVEESAVTVTFSSASRRKQKRRRLDEGGVICTYSIEVESEEVGEALVDLIADTEPTTLTENVQTAAQEAGAESAFADLVTADIVTPTITATDEDDDDVYSYPYNRRTLQFGFSETVVAGDDSSESTPVVTGELSFSGMTLEDAASNSGVIASGIANTFGVEESAVTVEFSSASRRKQKRRRLDEGGVICTYSIEVESEEVGEALVDLIADTEPTTLTENVQTAAQEAGAESAFADLVTADIVTPTITATDEDDDDVPPLYSYPYNRK